ncbi:putative cadmium/zinc-transporting ATPase HMA1, chloroplastic [Candidatus Clavichlamydia salmonicola]|uniref:cation-translocating P-type ATPase n=1 Tax=Candidatus Clavichlamydia salmonicola TaxID=469812 RepID=UPI001E471808|nr:cation-translocating P-type ATPase [Candidatus Clavichlamydia salmonicola]MBF5050531.1 putative cadmium/zinc-transporting ATPase HMA1, chloroplastic [Candidatus Clavichlamydia salmonicola]
MFPFFSKAVPFLQHLLPKKRPNVQEEDDTFEIDFSLLLNANGKKWHHFFSLKMAFTAAGCLICAFVFHLLNKASWSHCFCLLTFFFGGTQALSIAIKELFQFKANIDVLMTLAAFASVIIGSELEGGLLLVLFAISSGLGGAVNSKATGTLDALKKGAPEFATVITDTQPGYKKSIYEIKVGDSVLVKSGEIVPLDGVILNGHSSLNLSLLTGEALPIPCNPGDHIPGGARNLEGSFIMKVLNTGAESALEKTIRLVMQAQESKPKLQQRLGKLSSYYASSIISLSTIFACILPFIFNNIPFFGVEGSLYRSLAFLVAASPCALILAVPIAYLSAINACAKMGVLIKGGIILDALSSCDTIAFDKTGTITTGKLTCVKYEVFNISEDLFLPIILGIGELSDHPIAKAFVNFGKHKGISPCAVENYKNLTGFGASASYQNQTILIGQPSVLINHIAEPLKTKLYQIVNESLEMGRICSIAVMGSAVALFCFEDSIRPGIAETMAILKKTCQMRIVMLTGDHETSARQVGLAAGIEEIYFSMRPEDKLNKIKELASKSSLIMVGDGMNDAPALAYATVGIAMGQGGSPTATEAADIVLLQDNISTLVHLISKASQTRRIVTQNLMIAGSVICGISLPALLGIIPLWLAVILHEGGTIFVGLNALRLLRNIKRTKE